VTLTFELWPWKSIGFQILFRTKYVPSLVKIHLRMLILECSQGCYGRTDGSVTISLRNSIGEGIIKMGTIVWGTPLSTTTTIKDGDYCMRNTYVNNNKQIKRGLLYEEHLCQQQQIKMGIIVWGTPMSTTTTNKDGDYCMRNTYVNNNK
jgi:hypothetical protein